MRGGRNDGRDELQATGSPSHTLAGTGKVTRSMIRYRFKRYCVILGLGLSAGMLVCSTFMQEGYAQEKVKKEIAIKVKHNIIALPAGDVARVPVSVARVRSTDLRELNKKYNAVSIEKLFEIKSKSRALGLKGFKGVEPVEENAAPIDLTKLFTKKLKKKFIKEGKGVEQAQDVFLIQFELDKDTSINSLVNDYMGLDVVIDTKEVIRKE